MCTKIVIAITFCLVQVLAMPGMGMMDGMSMMSGGRMGGGMMSGGMMGGGVDLTAIKSMVTLTKQLGMSQALLSKNIKTANNEVKLQLDALKTLSITAPAGEPCATAADASAAEIETDLKTAFDKCQMKTEMQELRFQSLAMKQQMATMKMAKKACKSELDPAQCLADVAEATSESMTQLSEDSNTGLASVMTNSADCIIDVKENFGAKINQASVDLLTC